jgi:uncharacterized membrane protein (UPF0127 family)
MADARTAVVSVAGGPIVCERCVVADSFGGRLRGLLGRRELASGDGLLLRPSGAIHTWFMRFAIDAVFLDRELRVLRVAPALRPWRMAWRRRTRIVLELASGEAAARKITVGDRLVIDPGQRR